MRKLLLYVLCAVTMASCSSQFNTTRALQGGAKAMQAMTLSENQLKAYVSQSVAVMDKENKVLPDNNAYSKRLKKIVSGFTQVDGTPLNFKVYQTNEANAFACADGSVRVYTGLMDVMDDNEILGVIGHEIGHVALKHSLKQYKNALLTSAASDAIAAQGGVIGTISDAGLSALGQSLINAKYSRKHEVAADEYGYNFIKAQGKNPYALAMAFEQLKALSKSSDTSKSSAISQMFSTHPDLDSRIKMITDKCLQDGFKRP